MFPVTATLVALNVAVFIAMVMTGSSLWGSGQLLDQAQLIRWGANWGPGIHQGQYWRLLTSMFLHIGVLHLAFNMWAFWNLGQLTEVLVGRWRFLTIYLLSGIAGSALSYWLRPGLSAGASGAIFGIAGALIAVLKFAHLGVPSHALKPILSSVVSFAGYNLLIGAVVPHINNLAHLGGLIAGFVLGMGVAVQRRPQEMH
jgi:membrane associated rhomboid family serine protease